MAKTVNGAGRVTIFRLLHTWQPQRAAVVAYTSTGEYGTTGVVAGIPFPEVPDISLWDVAARHHPAGLGDWRSPVSGHSEACWILCTGTGARLTRYPATLDVPSTRWRLDVERTHDLGRAMYGHTAVVTGRLVLDQQAVMEQARTLLTEDDVAFMTAADLPAHTP
ncbi:hypothetical protein [Streptomyces sp. NPDC002640]